MKIIFKKPLWFTTITTLCLVVVALCAATSCHKPEKHDEIEANVVTKIEAKVENASTYSNVTEVKLMVYALSINNYIELARGDWNGDGFTIELPKTIDPNYLQVSGYNRGLLEPIDDPSLAMTINNKNVKAGTAHFWGIDKDGNVVTWFYPLQIDEDGNAKETLFSYVDADVSISGYNETEAIQDMMDENGVRIFGLVKTITTYSVKLKKGWNVWWLSNFVSVPEMIIINEWSTAPISIQKWYSFENKLKLLD